MIALVLSQAFAADCPADVPLSAWSASLDAAESAYRTLAVEPFDDTLDAAALDLRCLSEVVTPNAAARYHVLSGLRQYIRTGVADAVAEFAAARAADPWLTIDDALIPPGHELRSLIASDAIGPTEGFPPPGDGVSLVLDGTPTTSRPVDRPAILQVVGADGTVGETLYLLPGDPLPAYTPLEPGTLLDLPENGSRSSDGAPEPVPHRPRWGVLAASGLAAGAAVALYAVAAGSEAQFNGPLDDDLGKDDLVALRRRTNGLVLGAAVAGSLATGGLVVFVVAR